MNTPTSIVYLWERRTLHIGRLNGPVHVAQAAATLSVSLGDPMQVRVGGMERELSCRSLLLGPGQEAWVDTGNAIVATCCLDAFRQDYTALASQMASVTDAVRVTLRNEAHYQQVFADILARTPPSDQAYGLIDALMVPVDSMAEPVDPRVMEVVALIKASVVENHSVEALARQVKLSVPRLAELFRRHVGVPIRRYRQWHRLYVTAVGVAQGHTLTEAAIAAGFTDSSHFSHTFRALLGFTPSELLMQPGRVLLVAPANSEQDASLSRIPSSGGPQDNRLLP